MINKVFKLYKKYEESLNYVVVGGLTTLVSIGAYALLAKLIRIDHITSTILSWIIAVVFAFFTNKKYVFKNNDKGIKQFFKFIKYRLLTLGIEVAIMYLMVNILTIDDLISKTVAQVIVFISNYIFSKLFVFVKNKKV